MFSYPEQGATRGTLPDGYRHVQRRVRVGEGAQDFAHAAEALLSWRMHRGAGLAVPVAPRPRVGELVVVRLGPPVVGATAPCRFLYLVDEPRRRGFGYGTVAGHPFQGEEAFVVEWADDDGVYLSIRAFSRPATPFMRLMGPVVRWVQDIVTDRFAASMRREVTRARG